MKKILCICLLAVLLLSACTVVIGPVPQLPTFTLPQEPAQQWQPFDGEVQHYAPYHKTWREHAWEADVITLAQDFLTNHPYLRNEGTHMLYYAVQGLSATKMNLYKQDLREDFLQRINLLIPRLGELSDQQIGFELQKIVASLGDAHSRVYPETEYYFPILAEPFYVDGEPELRMVVLPRQHKNMLYAKLISINGVSMDEIIRRLTPYVSMETKYGLISDITDRGGLLYESALLAEVGVLKDQTQGADFVFQTEDGKMHTLWIPPIRYEAEIKVTDRSVYANYTYSFQNWETENFWYEILPEEKTAFVRITRFYEEENETLKDLFEKLMTDLNQNKQIDKVILDLRRNPGGLVYMEGFPRLIQALRLPQIEKVCVLVDQGSFSRSVVISVEILKAVDTAVLMGVPAGEGSFIIGIETDVLTLPNSNLQYRVATFPVDLDRENPFDTLMPDIPVYPTLEDYKNGVDMILKAAMKQ